MYIKWSPNCKITNVSHVQNLFNYGSDLALTGEVKNGFADVVAHSIADVEGVAARITSASTKMVPVQCYGLRAERSRKGKLKGLYEEVT